MKSVITCLSCALVASLATAWFSSPDQRTSVFAQTAPKSGPLLKTPPAGKLGDALFDDRGLTAAEAVAVAVYKKVNRSVVNITTRGARADAFFFLEVPSEGAGSGTVIDDEGHILTNYHVIENARAVTVTLFDGNTYDAEFIGADPVNDVAVIKVDAPDEVVVPATFGDSGKLLVGMHTYAIGNPFGLERTLSHGMISSLNRSLRLHRDRTVKSIIQIDADINPGNSGGPLLDSHGLIIGMNTAIASNTGQSAGVGFAIPANMIVRVIPQLIEHGRVIRPEIGIARVYETDKGLLIARLTPGGAAEKAGLRGPKVTRERRGPFIVEKTDRASADRIVAVDGRRVETVDGFLSYVESQKPGQTVKLTVIRDGRRVQIPVTLGGEQDERRQRSPRSRDDARRKRTPV